MSDHLETLARRVANDPCFLACPLHHFGASERMGDHELAAYLGCSMETLTLVRLCRSPDPNSAVFHKDIEQVATRFGLTKGVLAEAVRRGQAIWYLRQGFRGTTGTLLAARDAEQKAGDDS